MCYTTILFDYFILVVWYTCAHRYPMLLQSQEHQMVSITGVLIWFGRPPVALFEPTGGEETELKEVLQSYPLSLFRKDYKSRILKERRLQKRDHQVR